MQLKGIHLREQIQGEKSYRQGADHDDAHWQPVPKATKADVAVDARHSAAGRFTSYFSGQ